MSYSKEADPMSMMVENLTQAVPTSLAAAPFFSEIFFSVETRLDLEMWNLTKATLTRNESLRSSELKKNWFLRLDSSFFKRWTVRLSFEYLNPTC